MLKFTTLCIFMSNKDPLVQGSEVLAIFDFILREPD